jgi:hypothetical protein
MTQLNSQASDLQWIKQVRSLLIEVARASLTDIPRLPNQVSTDALPLAQQAQVIQEKTAQGADPSTWQSQQSQWIEAVRQLLLELSRISLSDSPRLPENIAHRTLTLVETAQDIQEVAENNISADEADQPNLSAPLAQLLDQVQAELQAEQHNSVNPEAPEWQRILTLLTQIQDLYHQLHQST